MSYIAFAIVGEAFVFFSLAFAKRKKPLPKIVKRSFVIIGRLLFISPDEVEEFADEVLDEDAQNHNQSNANDKESSERKLGKDVVANSVRRMSTIVHLDVEDSRCRDWFYVAMVSSRLTTFIYLFLIIVTPLIMFLTLPGNEVPQQVRQENLTVTPS